MNINFNPYFSAKESKTNTLSRRRSASEQPGSINEGGTPGSQDTVTISPEAKREAAYTDKAGAAEKVLVVAEPADTTGTMLPENIDLYYLGESLKLYTNTIEDYYAKRNEENNRFADPEKHIWRKYWDRNYKYYEKGLTESERQWGWEQERAAYNGYQLGLSPYDPAIIKTFGRPGNGSFPIDNTLKARQSMNEALNQIFKESGIVIPDGTDLRLTIDPYDYYIKASGVDENLAKKIETALNRGGNGESLYSHIMFSHPGRYGVSEEPPQYRKGNPWKTSLFIAVKESTGYDLRELERKDGQFLTPDGQNVWDLINDEYKIGQHYDAYRNMAWYGWDYVADEDRTIGYKDGSLYDVDTNYGYGPGQTGWIDSRRELDERNDAQYMRERAETLRREESMPNRYERAFAAVEPPDGVKVNADAYGNYAGLFQKGALEQAQTSLFDYVGPGSRDTIWDEILRNGVAASKPITAIMLAQMNSALRSKTGSLSSEIFGIPSTSIRKTRMNLRA